MNTLSSNSSLHFFSGKNGFISTTKNAKNSGRSTKICSFEYLKHFNFDLISTQQRKFIRPVVSSSLPTLTLDSQVELESSETQTQLKTVRVKMQLQKQCMYGEKFLLVGDDPMFGSWDPSDAIPLHWSVEHMWTAELDIPIGRSIQFKFVLKQHTGNILWQPGPDRVLRTWETSHNTITVLEDWENAELQKTMENDGSVFQKENEFADENMYIDPVIAQSITQSSENDVGRFQNDEMLIKHEEDGPVLVPDLAPLL